MAGRQPEPPRGAFHCQYCGAVWNSARGLAVHIKAHLKGKAPAAAAFPAVPPGFRPPGPRRVPVMPPVFLPPPPPAAMAPAAGLFFGGLRPRRPPLLVRRPLPPDPVVSAGPGGTIRMVPLEPNHAFWAPYRMGMDDAPVELDFMGLRPRPESPSPSFASWLNA